ncbi:MAG: OadG family protein [Bacteriovoracaceae bacterium]|nr:OadG family protein [Bacteriovoracaceae bacterium]
MKEAMNISWDNLFIGDFNALTFSILGVSVVFSGLILISLYIAVLPKVLAFFEIDHSKKNANSGMVNADPKEAESNDEEIMIAIALAIHMDQTYGEQNQKFTWDENAPSDRSWKQAMHGEVLASRQNLPLRRL